MSQVGRPYYVPEGWIPWARQNRFINVRQLSPEETALKVERVMPYSQFEELLLASKKARIQVMTSDDITTSTGSRIIQEPAQDAERVAPITPQPAPRKPRRRKQDAVASKEQ